MTSLNSLNRTKPSLNQMVIGLIAGGLIISASMGVRQSFGLFIDPFSYDRGIPVTQIAFAIALHNLVWGVAQPFAGAAADRRGAAPVVAFGAVVFALGLAMAAYATSDFLLTIGLGVLVGIGVSCISFGVVLTTIGRSIAPEKRSLGMGLVGACGSLGQVVLVPVAQWILDFSGAKTALLVLAAIVLAVAPLGLFIGGKSSAPVNQGEADHMPLRAALDLAFGNSGYCLLTIGFFTCGFQLAFISTYLPGYLSLCHMPIGLGATALAVIGLFNMLGSWGCGWLGGRFRQQYVLGWLYMLRGAIILAFFLGPKTELTVLLFAAIMGLTWLGTVPLTSGLVAKIFGTQHLGVLFGICFFSHQIGSFLGAWLGGYLFDTTGSYSIVWILTAIAGFVAAMLNFAINDAPASNNKIERTPEPALQA